MGGETPTVTDANVVLGYLNPEHLVGGALPIDAEKAAAALAEQVDLLVAHHAIPEQAGAIARSLHMPPSVIVSR